MEKRTDNSHSTVSPQMGDDPIATFAMEVSVYRVCLALRFFQRGALEPCR